MIYTNTLNDIDYDIISVYIILRVGLVNTDNATF